MKKKKKKALNLMKNKKVGNFALLFEFILTTVRDDED
jgi:hypothetical protein